MTGRLGSASRPQWGKETKRSFGTSSPPRSRQIILRLKVNGLVFRRHGDVADLLLLAPPLLLRDQRVDLLFHGRRRAGLHAYCVGLGCLRRGGVDWRSAIAPARAARPGRGTCPRRAATSASIASSRALLFPGRLPVRAFAQAGFGVAQGGEERHGFGVDELRDQRTEVGDGAAGVEFGDGNEVGIAARRIGEGARRDDARFVRAAR